MCFIERRLSITSDDLPQHFALLDIEDISDEDFEVQELQTDEEIDWENFETNIETNDDSSDLSLSCIFTRGNPLHIMEREIELEADFTNITYFHMSGEIVNRGIIGDFCKQCGTLDLANITEGAFYLPLEKRCIITNIPTLLSDLNKDFNVEYEDIPFETYQFFCNRCQEFLYDVSIDELPQCCNSMNNTEIFLSICNGDLDSFTTNV